MILNYFKKLPFFVIVLLFVFLFNGCKKENVKTPPVARPVKMTTIKRAPELNHYIFPGKVEADKKVTLAFQVQGIIKVLPISIGQIVSKGQVLAMIDERDYKNQYDKVKAKLLIAESEYKRAEKLVEKHAISESLYESRRTNYQIAKSDMAMAEKACEDIVLRAPFSGIIAQVFVDNYQDVTKNDPILVLQTLKKLKIAVYVPGTFILGIDDYKNHKATVSFPTLQGRSFPLTLKEFSTKADPATQAFKVVFSMTTPPKDVYILPGMTAKVEATLKSRINRSKELLVIPASAIATNPDGTPYVWIINTKDNTVHKKAVKVGKLTYSNIIITDGLQYGETIATSGVHYLREGEKVRPFNLKEYN